MDCRILRHVTLKANGHLGCDDSVGYDIDLGRVDPTPEWRIKDVLNGPTYRHVRGSFRKGQVPWPNTCNGCDLLSNGGIPLDTLDTRLELLVEPTLACTLSCACCLRKHIIAGGRSTAALDPEILRTFVESCRADNIALDQVHYIGWGEPLLHGQFRTLFDIVAAAAPTANQMVTTAGNVDFRATVGSAQLQRLVVSCDGATPQSYSKYRRGGDFATVVRFMRDCREYGHPDIYLEWKYILFEFNDSDEELFAAQQLADEIGVDSLLFIITNSKWHSQRFTVANAKNFPLRSLRASISPAAALSAIAMSCQLSAPTRSLRRGCGNIDACSISIGSFLSVEGWAYAHGGAYPTHLELLLDGAVRARTKVNLRRGDAFRAHPGAAGPNCGFLFRVPVETTDLPQSVQIRVVSRHSSYLLGGPSKWQVPSSALKTRNDLPQQIQSSKDAAIIAVAI